MSKLLVACLAVLAISVHANEKILRQTLYQRRAANVRQLSFALESGGARNYVKEFTQIFNILRSEASVESQNAQIQTVTSSVNDGAKILVTMIVPPVQQNLEATRKAYAGASPQVQLAANEIKKICINIDVLLDLNGTLAKLKNAYDSLDINILKELKNRSSV